MSTSRSEVAVELDPADPLKRVSLRRAVTSGIVLPALAAAIAVGIASSDHHLVPASIAGLVIAAVAAALALYVGRGSPARLRATAEGAPLASDGIVEGRIWASAVRVYYAWSGMLAVGFLLRVLDYLGADLGLIGLALLVAGVVAASYGLAGAVWLMRWERRSGLLLLDGARLVHNRSGAAYRLRRFMSASQLTVVRASRVAGPAGRGVVRDG